MTSENEGDFVNIGIAPSTGKVGTLPDASLASIGVLVLDTGDAAFTAMITQGFDHCPSLWERLDPRHHGLVDTVGQRRAVVPLHDLQGRDSRDGDGGEVGPGRSVDLLENLISLLERWIGRVP